MLYIQPSQVLNCISGFSGIGDARTLYCTLLNYGYHDLPIPVEDRCNGKIIAKGSDLAELDTFLKREVGSVFEEGGIDSTKPIREQEPNPLPDRAELDNIVFNELGLTEEGRKEVYWGGLRVGEAEVGEGEECEEGIKMVNNKCESELEMKFFDEAKIKILKELKLLEKGD